MLTKCEPLKKEIVKVLEAVREKKPLVYCITNYVTVGDCANIVLASGASPIMAEDHREVEQIVSAAKAVVLNIGTLRKETVEAMVIAGKKANELGVPVVFDPVGAGATKLRNDTAKMLTDTIRFSVIRGNMSEIRALAGLSSATKGVDAGMSDALTHDNIEAGAKVVSDLAKRLDCCIAATGAIDIIAYGDTAYAINNGHAMMADITGSGCMCSSVVGACLGSGMKNPAVCAAAAIAAMCIAGEKAYEYAAKNGGGIGTFREKLFNYVYTMSEADLMDRGEIYEIKY